MHDAAAHELLLSYAHTFRNEQPVAPHVPALGQSPSEWQPQDPAMHAWPAPSAAHEMLQSPQCEGSLLTSTQLPPQFVVPVGQGVRHTPSVHTAPFPHTWPQPPQLNGSLAKTTQAPAHSVCPGA